MLLELSLVESSFELGSSAKQAMLEQIYKLDMFFQTKLKHPTFQLVYGIV